jgi:fatty-acyl-CoA synthase
MNPPAAHAQHLGLGSWPSRRAALTPDAVALSFEGEDITYAQLSARVDAQAAWMQQEAGIGQGDRVAYFGANHPALLETLFAAGRIGAVAVLVNARLAREEVLHLLNDSGARLLFVDPALWPGLARPGQDEAPALEAVIPVEQAPQEITAGRGVTVLDLAMARGRGGELVGGLQVPGVGLEDPCLLMYTSGTTGRPKGAVLTNGNLFFNDVNVLIESDIRPDEVMLCVAPLFHIAGLNGLVLPVLLKGGRVVVHRAFHPVRALEAIVREGVTSLFGVPAMLDAMASAPGFGETDLSSLRTLIVGGAPVPERLLRQWAERGVQIQQGYGLTETAPAVLKLAAEDATQHLGSAGKPQFLVDVRLVGLDGEDVGVGETGEILTRGPNVFHEYWGMPEASQAAFQEGWFRTGDVAVRDADGYYTLRDRAKDMYISGGENVYPSEVESALLDVPGVAEAAVIGVPDPRWGEVGRAYIVPASGSELSQDDVLEALQGRLARYKQPRSVVVLEEMPRTSTGKLQKQALRARTEDGDPVH